MPVHQTCQLTVWNFILQDCCLVECHSRELLRCCSSTYMPAGQVYFTATTPLLFKYAYWLSAAARWMLAGSLPPNSACWLVLCFSICHTCWNGVSLSAVPAGVTPHYRPYLLIWCLNISLLWCLSIGHAFWCGASLQAIPSGVVPTISYACWCVASL